MKPSIEERKKEILKRDEFGHWELDTVYSKKNNKAALLVLTERMTRQEIIVKMKDRTMMSTNKAIEKIYRSYGSKRFRSTFKTTVCTFMPLSQLFLECVAGIKFKMGIYFLKIVTFLSFNICCACFILYMVFNYI